ncbi:MAG: crotonase/enoyl-CoA hydratase family protein [Thermodesulfobacteriota bacterium]
MESDPPIARVFLNRPEKKNAMNPPAWREVPEVFSALDADPDVRVILLAGNGPCFSTGIDIAGMIPEIPELLESEQKGGVKWRLLPKIRDLQEAINAVERCRKPVIAAVHGHCLGAGLDLASACDIRLCSRDAVFSVREAAVGFVADVGVLQRLPRIVGQGMARELAFTAAFVDAERARRILLVNEVFEDRADLLDAARAMATEIAENSPLAVQASKDVLNFSAGRPVEDGLRYVASVSANIIPSYDLLEAMAAFSEKRKPIFTGK